MKMDARISALATQIGTDVKTIISKIGPLGGLNTANKGNIVNAINELSNRLINMTTIDDNASVIDKTWSSQKIDTLISELVSAYGAVNLWTDNGQADGYGESTVIDVVRDLYQASKTAVTIDDTLAAADKAWSSQKINQELDARFANLLDSAPEEFNTLKEIADWIANDQTGTAALTQSVNEKVSFKQAQNLTAPEQLQACENIGIGNPDTDFLAIYEAAKVPVTPR